jgi:hypothetical protein
MWLEKVSIGFLIILVEDDIYDLCGKAKNK